jgi:hypothetical protein
VATAPTPHQADVAAGRTATAQASITMTMRGETRTVYPNNIPMRLRLAIRNQTGHPLTAWVEEIDLDSIAVLWWVAAVQEGAVAKSYSWQQAIEDWPDDLTVDELEVSEDDGETAPEDASPEA